MEVQKAHPSDWPSRVTAWGHSVHIPPALPAVMLGPDGLESDLLLLLCVLGRKMSYFLFWPLSHFRDAETIRAGKNRQKAGKLQSLQGFFFSLEEGRHLLDGLRQTRLPVGVLMDGLAFRVSQTVCMHSWRRWHLVTHSRPQSAIMMWMVCKHPLSAIDPNTSYRGGAEIE